jgi:hypothetical protein
MFRLILCICLCFTMIGFAQEPPGPAIGNDTESPPKPVMEWRFDQPGEWGIPESARRDAGPRPPSYPGFAPNNQAWTCLAPKDALHLPNPKKSELNLQFSQGDAITLEAWVKVAELKAGSYAYIVGKGRSRREGYPEKNQNYALRIFGAGKGAKITFLFASAAEKGQPSEWHRWTSNDSFTLGGWHHIAITYTFGKSQSIKGVIDGVVTPGTWDMGGATDRPPVVDDDQVSLGTGNGGGTGNTFVGSLDDIRIWRTALPTTTLTSRFEFLPPPPVLRKEQIPSGEVLVQLCEDGMPGRNAWPDSPLPATESYREPAFGFFEVPHKYVSTGVRGDRANPFLLRAAAKVTFPAGTHKLLLRGRGAARLYVDGKLILANPFPNPDSSGHGSIRKPESYLNLGPDFRFAPPGNRESTTVFTASGQEQVLVLETIVGNYIGKSLRRPELGETVVAVLPQGASTWQLVTPTKSIFPYTDAGWATYEADRQKALDTRNAAARQARRAEHQEYWAKRRQAAATWLQETAEVPVPSLPKNATANNSIDHFIAARHADAVLASANRPANGIDYHKDVQPILEAHCYSCHAGTKVRGGLRLDDRQQALKGGSSDTLSIVPGQPEKSLLLERVHSKDPTEMMPPKGERLSARELETLQKWIAEGAHWPEVRVGRTQFAPLTDDLTFLRRVTLDTVGVVPTLAEIEQFLADDPKLRRSRVIDRLLADPRWADHWVGYWQDVLAENPNILNPTLNNSGPFRWWIYESFLDNKPLDLFVTELIRQQGSVRFGGPAGFAVASQNDAPLAEKGMIVASAFLGTQMKCARCHDAPAHRSTQQDLFQLAALLGDQVQKLPATSTVATEKLSAGGREPLIKVSLKPGSEIVPRWPFEHFAPGKLAEALAENPQSARDRLASLITAPQNERFAQVMVNRLWQRLLGRGIVEPVEDWEKGTPSHPELLKWLGRELVRSGYDFKHVARLILNSQTYQRQSDPTLTRTDPHFAASAPRRLEAEQIVDGLFTATGKLMKLEEVSLDIDGSRDMGNSITLGKPRRAWMLTSTSNERDRPSLALPRIQAVADVLQAFGWRGSRQEPLSLREQDPNVLQTAILANGTMTTWLTRLSDDHPITKLAQQEQSLDTLIDTLFLRMLTRKPTSEERVQYRKYLEPGYATRRVTSAAKPASPRQPEPYVSWSNHLAPEATLIRQQQEEAARRGDPASENLDPTWRTRLEDVLWALVNSREMIFRP